MCGKRAAACRCDAAPPSPATPPEVRRELARQREFEALLATRCLYKYTWRVHAEGLVTHGRVRVGTLDDFRRQEHEAELRRDRADGTAQFVEGIDFANGPDLSPFARGVIGDPPPGARVSIADSWVTQAVTHPNAYAYCCSYELSRAAAGNYDACLEIRDPFGFFRAMDDALRRTLGVAGSDAHLTSVLYADGVLSHHLYGHVNPGFVKQRTPYEVEREVRVLWRSPAPPLEGPHAVACYVEAPALRRYVQLVDIPAG